MRFRGGITSVIPLNTAALPLYFRQTWKWLWLAILCVDRDLRLLLSLLPFLPLYSLPSPLSHLPSAPAHSLSSSLSFSLLLFLFLFPVVARMGRCSCMDLGSGSRQAKRGQKRTPGRGFWSLEHVAEWQPGANGGGISPSPPRFRSAKNHPLGSKSTEDRHWPLLLDSFFPGNQF